LFFSCRESNGPARERRAILRDEASDVLKVRSGKLAALAHDVVAELLSLIEVAHSSALDGGDVNEHILAAVFRLDEAEALLRIEKLNGTCSHIWPPVKTPNGVNELHDIA
jgi:hypothetical protein